MRVCICILAGTLFFILPALVGGLLFAGCGSGLLIARRFRHVGWDYCPETPAKIQSGHVCLSDDGNYSHIGYVVFTYRVASEDYSGLCAKSFPTEEEASAFVEDCSVHELAVRYKPEMPEEALLFTIEPVTTQVTSGEGSNHA